jgi:hypothetical protein
MIATQSLKKMAKRKTFRSADHAAEELLKQIDLTEHLRLEVLDYISRVSPYQFLGMSFAEDDTSERAITKPSSPQKSPKSAVMRLRRHLRLTRPQFAELLGIPVQGVHALEKTKVDD